MPEKAERLSWLSLTRRRTTGNLKTLSNRHRRSGSDEAIPETSSVGIQSVSRPSPSRPMSNPSVLVASLDSASEFDQAREEVKRIHDDVSRLEDNVGKMLQVVEKNTEGVRRLTEGREQGGKDSNPSREEIYASELSGHLWRMGDMLTKNMEHIENLAKRQIENEQKLQNVLEDLSSRDCLNISQLDSTMDRMQRMMEESVAGRHGSHRGNDVLHRVDFSPLCAVLKTLQESVEQNSALMREMLPGVAQDGSASPTTKAWWFHPLQTIDLSPLSDHLQGLHDLLSTQNCHMGAVVEAQEAMKRAVENGIDFTTLAEHMESVRESVERIPRAISFGPLAEHFEAMKEATDANARHIRELIEIQRARSTPTTSPSKVDLSPLTDRLDRMHATLKDSNSNSTSQDQPAGAGSPPFILSALSAHLSKIQTTTEQNANAVKSLVSTQAHGAAATTAKQRADMESVEKRLDATNGQVRELMTSQKEMTNAVRELAQAITEQNKGSCCDHVVIPPPRKMGRKVVGFIYDAKEGL